MERRNGHLRIAQWRKIATPLSTHPEIEKTLRRTLDGRHSDSWIYGFRSCFRPGSEVQQSVTFYETKLTQCVDTIESIKVQPQKLQH